MSGRIDAGVLEGQTVDQDLDLTADVCIIGSGAGGAVTAWCLARAGLSVLVLEEGGYFTSPRFRMQEAEAYPDLYQEAATRTTADQSVSIYQGRCVGGGTVINWTTCFRLPERVYEHWRKRHHVGDIDAAALLPHYEAVEERLGIRQVDLATINHNNRALYDGCRALGWTAEPLRRNVRGCARTGFCGLGCPIDAKQSMLVTYLPDAMDHGATVLSRCRVERLDFAAGQATVAHGALLDASGRDPTGCSVRVRAKRFVLAAGAIGTPALLLRSGAPDPHQLTGRRTFLHPVVVSAAAFAAPVDPFYGAPQSVASHHFADRGNEVGFFMESAPVHPVLMSTAFPQFGTDHRREMGRIAHYAAHIALAIDGFRDDVEGGRVDVDEDGAPVLHYTPAPAVCRAFVVAQKSLAKAQLAAGAQRVSTLHNTPQVMRKMADVAALDGLDFGPGRLWMGSAHQMGGCAMGDDPRHAVVRSADLRHHHVDNVHVIDGSIFPTSLGVNPQETIYAHAHLIATRLAQAWR